MEDRKKLVEARLTAVCRDVAGLSRTFGIGRKTGYKWVQRAVEGGWEGLMNRHSRPSDPC